MNGVFKFQGARTVRYEVPMDVLANAKPVVVEAPVVVPEPVAVVVEVPVVVPEPVAVVVEVPVVVPEPVVVVEVPVAEVLEVEAPLEVSETAPESGLVPENPPTE